MAYDYESSVDFRGDAAGALELIRERLSTKGFKVIPPAANRLYFENSVSIMKTKKQPLLTVSKGCAAVAGGALTVQAEFGVMRRQIKFICIALAIMAIPETALVVALIQGAEEPGLLPCVLAVAVLPLTLPLTFRLQRRNTSRALDALLKEATVAGQGRKA